VTELFGKRTAFRIFNFFGPQVLNVNHAAVNHRATAYCSAMKRNIIADWN
jgi:hypothetical protein